MPAQIAEVCTGYFSALDSFLSGSIPPALTGSDPYVRPSHSPVSHILCVHHILSRIRVLRFPLILEIRFPETVRKS